MRFDCITSNNKQLPKVTNFLMTNGLQLDEQVERFVVFYNDQDEIIACGGLAGNIIKCVAISEMARGEGIALQLISELTKLAYEQHRINLFIYTKPEYESLFHDCGFYRISSALPYVVLLENSKTRLTKQIEQWQAQRVAGKKIGGIVMNANPFTLGHRYLIEQALNQCDHLHVFVVGEDASQFTYADRFHLVQQGIANLDRITLHGGSDYIISRATFPSYFLKDQGLVEQSYMEIDLRLFREKIAPALGINVRFVGSEPICATTAEYNRQMHYWLETDLIDAPKVEVIEIDREKINGEIISASKVRSLLAEKKFTELEKFVPLSTLDFLKHL